MQLLDEAFVLLKLPFLFSAQACRVANPLTRPDAGATVNINADPLKLRYHAAVQDRIRMHRLASLLFLVTLFS